MGHPRRPLASSFEGSGAVLSGEGGREYCEDQCGGSVSVGGGSGNWSGSGSGSGIESVAGIGVGLGVGVGVGVGVGIDKRQLALAAFAAALVAPVGVQRDAGYWAWLVGQHFAPGFVFRLGLVKRGTGEAKVFGAVP